MAHTELVLRFPKAMTAAELAKLSPLIHPFLDLGAESSTHVVEPKFTYKVMHDPDPDNPRTSWDNIGVMHCAHTRYTLGDAGALTPFVDDDWRSGIERDDIYVTLPIYMYDHSGITISHSPFSCRWDSGLLGWHYITKQAVEKNWPSLQHDEVALRDAVERCLTSELKTYDQYLQGQVYGYRITDEEGDEVDSCWGFYGDDIESNGMLDSAGTEHAEGLRKAWNERFN